MFVPCCWCRCCVIIIISLLLLLFFFLKKNVHSISRIFVIIHMNTYPFILDIIHIKKASHSDANLMLSIELPISLPSSFVPCLAQWLLIISIKRWRYNISPPVITICIRLSWEHTKNYSLQLPPYLKVQVLGLTSEKEVFITFIVVSPFLSSNLNIHLLHIKSHLMCFRHSIQSIPIRMSTS